MTFPFTLPSRYGVKGPRLDGGQAHVYVCEDTFLGRYVAIKLLKPIGGKSDALEREISALTQIQSPHIAGLYDLVKAKNSNQIGIVQEYVPGKTLSESVADGSASFLAVMWQISGALRDVHDRGLIHRDIKPENARFDAEGILKVLDFGLASRVESAETLRSRGSIGFRAPELFHTPPVRYTKAVDIYALGVTAWYVKNGGKLPASLLENPPGLKSIIPSLSPSSDCPAHLASLIDKCLALNPGDRPSAAEIHAAFAAQLLYNRHRALLAYGSRTSLLDSQNSEASLRAGDDRVALRYDGTQFSITETGGNVYINNVPVSLGQILPGSSVITLGHPNLGYHRTFVTLDMSHPGVVL